MKKSILAITIISSVLFAGAASAKTYSATNISADEAIAAVKEKAARDGAEISIKRVIKVGDNFIRAEAESV